MIIVNKMIKFGERLCLKIMYAKRSLLGESYRFSIHWAADFLHLTFRSIVGNPLPP